MKSLSQFPFLRGGFVAHQFPKHCCGHGSKVPRLPLVYVLPSPCLRTRFTDPTASISLGPSTAVIAAAALTAAALKLKRQHSANPIPQRSNWRRLCQAALSEFSLDGRHEGTTKGSGEGTTLTGQEGTHGYETDDLFYSLQLGIILTSFVQCCTRLGASCSRTMRGVDDYGRSSTILFTLSLHNDSVSEGSHHLHHCCSATPRSNLPASCHLTSRSLPV
jgi:hypothetical protein